MLKKLIKSIQIREWWFIGVVSLIMIILSGAPYLYAILTAPDQTIFTGFHALTTGDFPVYYSYIAQVAYGKITISNIFSGSDDGAWPFSPFWYVIGFIARLFHLSPPLAFHITRLALIPLLIFVLYVILKYYFSDYKKCVMGMIFMLFASGLGSYVSFFMHQTRDFFYHNWPMDLWVPESVTFMSLYHSPHILASLIGLIVTIFLMYFGMQYRRWSYILAASIVSIFLFLLHPFHILSVSAIIGVYFLVKSSTQKDYFLERIRYMLVFAGTTCIIVLYDWNFLHQHPIIAEMSKENFCFTPSLWLILISYGMLIPLAIVGIVRIVRKHLTGERYIFLVVWFTVHLLMLYAPVIWQRRLTEGFQIPLILLALIAVFWIWERFGVSWLKTHHMSIMPYLVSVIGFILFFLPSNIYVLFQDIQIWSHYRKDSIHFMPSSTNQALRWIRENTEFDDVFLSGSLQNQWIAGFAGRRVYYGHSILTRNLTTRLLHAQIFFKDNTANDTLRRIVEQGNIDYIYLPDMNNNTPLLFEKNLPEWLDLVYSKDGIRIYKYNPEP